MPNRRHIIQAALASACLPLQAQPATSPPSTDISAAIRSAMAGTHRSAANSARDTWRHPLESLLFFGLQPGSRVVELAPGGGWYTEILAPVLRERGQLIAAHFDPQSLQAYQRRSRAGFEAKLAGLPAVYDRVRLATMPTGDRFSDIQPTDGVDLVLTFRNVHNWQKEGTLAHTLSACLALLKPGGVLGVVDHRAAPQTDQAAMAKSGYVTEAFMREQAVAAGFAPDGQSEVNANPRDTKDHARGVWALPPSLAGKDDNRAFFEAIGESDRFTHRYRKPMA